MNRFCMLSKSLRVMPLLGALLLLASFAEADLGCHDCHGSRPSHDIRPVDAPFRNVSTGGFPGNHRTHLPPGASPSACDPCHASTAGIPSAYTAGHRNGYIETAENINESPHPARAMYTKNGLNASSFPQTATSTPGSCENVNCHFESGTAPWGSSLLRSPEDCGTCHGNPPATGSHSAVNGKHSAFGCSQCHPSHTSFSHATSVKHPDKNIVVRFSQFPNDGGSYSGDTSRFLPSRSAGKTYGNCSSIYCHSNGSETAPPGLPRIAPAWGETLDCSGCHGDDTATLTTGSHAAHLRGASCSGCHSSTASSSNAIRNTAFHTNKSVDLSFQFNNTTTGTARYGGQASPIAKIPGTPPAKCTTTYCHSDGTAVSSRTISQWKRPALEMQAVNQGQGETPAWGSAAGAPSACAQSDGRHCSACHYYPPSWGSFHGYSLRAECGTCHTDIEYGNTVSFVTPYPVKCAQCHDYPPKYPTKRSGYGPKSNVHNGSHAYPAYMCSDCHYDTTADGMTINDAAKHGNGTYDIKNGPNVSPFTYTYDKEGGTCTASCHSARSWSANRTGGASGSDPFIEALVSGCQTYNFALNVSNRSPYTYALPLRNILWDFGDGTKTDPADGVNGTAVPLTHQFAQPGPHVVSVSAQDQNGVTVSGRATVNVTGYFSGNKYAIPNFALSTAGNTVTVTDLSTDIDAGACAPSLGGRVYIDWGDGSITEEPVMFSPTPSGRTFSHTYQSPGQYCVSHRLIDSSGSGTQSSRAWQKLQIPPDSPDDPLAKPVISGMVKSYDGSTLEGAQVTLYNSCSTSIAKVVATTMTTPDGSYRFTGTNWYDNQYCVGAAKDGFIFPNLLPANMYPCLYDIEHLNFVASTPAPDPGSSPAGTMTISGRVTDAAGNGTSAPMWLLIGGRPYYSQGHTWPTSSSSGQPAETGKYSLAGLLEDCYLVKMPSYSSDSGRWEFDPPEQEVCQSNPEVNFTARKVPVISAINGTVYDSVTGKPVGLPSVRLSLKDQTGTVVRTTNTSGNGYYRFWYSPFEVPEGYSWTFWGYSSYDVPPGTYTIEAEQEGYTFTPIQVTGKAGDWISSGTNIYGTQTLPRMTMAGKLIDQSGGIMTTYNRPSLRIKKGADILEYPSISSSNTWQSQSLLKGCYTVELYTTNDKLTFSPASREICDTLTDVDFTVSPNPAFPLPSAALKGIRGVVRDAAGNPIAGVEVKLKDAAGLPLQSVWTTGGSANFYFDNLQADKCFIIEPTRPGFTFSPASTSYCLPRGISDMAFVATDNRGGMLRGRISKEDGTGADGVIVRLKEEDSGSVIKTVTSITGGWYSFGKPGPGCYLIEPVGGVAPVSPAYRRVCGGAADADFIFANPSPEAGTVATATGIQRIDLRWADTFSDETGFTVERCTGDGCTDFAPLADVGPDITLYSDTTACVGIYGYRIKAYKSGGWESFSPVATATTSTPPAPADLQATTPVDSRVKLTWSNPGAEGSGFKIERCSGGGCSDFAQIAAVGAGTDIFIDNPATTGEHSYRVRSYGDGTCAWHSDYSSPIAVTNVNPPINDLSVNLLGTSTVNLSWAGYDAAGTGYKIERCAGEGCSEFTQAAAVSIDTSMLARLEMNETSWEGTAGEVTDGSGRGNHGTAFQGATTAPGGVTGRAGSFDGVKGHAVVPADGRELTQWTVELWVKPAAGGTSGTVFQWADSETLSSAVPFLRLDRTVYTGTSYLYWGFTGNFPMSAGPGARSSNEAEAKENEWTHVAVTYDGNWLRYYRNGTILYQSEYNLYTPVQQGNARYAYFGGGRDKNGTATSYFKGLMDGANIYRRALTDAEIVARYQQSAVNDTTACSATSYTYRARSINSGLSNAGGGCWTTRAPVVIDNDKFQPNYQVRLTVASAAGMQPDFDDLRFYDADAQKELPHWLEMKTDGSSATVWLRTGTSTRIYLYYGNGAATSASNGKRTFEAFDDFRDTNPVWKTGTIWADGIYNNASSGNLSESGGTLNFNYKSYSNYTWDTSSTQLNEVLITGIPQTTDFHAQVKLNSYTVPDQTLAGIALIDRYFSSVYQFGRYRNDATGTNSMRLQRIDGTNVTDNSDTSLPRYLAVRKSASGYSFLVSSDNVSWTQVGETYNDFAPLKLALFGRELSNGSTVLPFSMDDFYIRKHVAQEPEASIGEAETLGSCQTLAWEGSAGSSATLTIPAPPPPTGVTVQAYDTQATLSWTDTTTTETGFKVERCKGAGCADFTQIGTPSANALSFPDPGPLEVGATYSYRIRATKSTACTWDSDYSAVATATTAYLSPGSLAATTGGITQINLGWTDQTRSETGFKIERCQGSGCTDFTQIGTANANAVSYPDNAACKGTSYTYRVRPYNTTLWDGPYSNEVSAVTTIPTPVNDLVTRVLSDTKMELTWTDRTSGETGFAVERCDYEGCSDFREITTAVANSSRYIDSGLAPGARYSYRVRAVNTTAACPWNSDYSNVAIAASGAFPPAGLTATAVNTTRVNLSWTDTNAAESTHIIERCAGASCTEFTQLAALGANSTTYTDDTAAPSTEYSYRVKAASPAFSNGAGGCWSKRTKVNFTNFQPNYQTRVSISYDTEMQTDFDDIRFYDATTGQELPYWVETISNGSYEYVWLKTGANNNVYMYFGNGAATTVSNGRATFEVFDDFNDGIVDTALWTILPGNGTITESGGVLNVSYTGSTANDWNAAGRQGTALRLNTLPTGDFLAGVKMILTTVNDLTQTGIAVFESDTNAYLMGRYRSGSTSNYTVQKNDGTGTAGTSATANYVNVFRSGNQYSFGVGYYMSDFVAVGGSLADIPFSGLALFGKEWGTATTSNVSFTMDNFFVRRKTAVEPTTSVSNYAKESAAICADQWTTVPSAEASVDTPAPAPPTDLGAQAVSDNRVRLAWTDSSDETLFRVERCGGIGCGDFTEIGTAGANATSFIDSGLPAAGAFTYRVRGYKSTGATEWYSSYSNDASTTVAPASPAGLAATPTAAGILVSWDGKVPGASGYTIERCSGADCSDYAPTGTVGDATSFTDTTAASGSSYRYRVRAFGTPVSNSGGACWSVRVPIAIDNYQPSYQTRVTVPLDASMRSDFADLRFYDTASGQELPYWIDSVSATSATAWVRTGTNNSIYLYCGNPAATSASNGKNTFLLFDDFNDGTIDSNLWTVLSGNGTISESGGVLNFSYTGANDNDWNGAGRSGTALRLNALPQGNLVAEVTLNSAKASNLYTVNTKTMAGLGFYNSDTSAFLLGRYNDEVNSVFKMKNDGTAKEQVYGSYFPLYLKLKKVNRELTTSPPFAPQYQFKAESGSRSTISFTATGDAAFPTETVVLFGREWGTGSSDMSFDLDNFLVRKYMENTSAMSEPAATVNLSLKEGTVMCPDTWTGPYSNEIEVVTP